MRPETEPGQCGPRLDHPHRPCRRTPHEPGRFLRCGCEL